MSKRCLLACLGALLLMSAALLLASRDSDRYFSDVMVLTKPFTNEFFTRSFEAEIVRSIPGVLGLRVIPAFNAIPGSGVPVLTNGVSIEIITLGATPQDSQRVANDAARQFCRSVLTNYGVNCDIVDRAITARRYSYFHDSFQPAIARLFR